MKKTISTLILLLFVVVIPLCSFTACDLFKSISFTETKANLQDAGYNVIEMTGEEFVESEYNKNNNIFESELEHFIYATKGDDVIKLYFFKTINIASSNYESMHDDKLLAAQKNEVVYFATKQAKKDAGIK